MPTNRFEIVTGQRKMHSIKLFVVIILWVCIRLVSFYYLYKTMFPFFPLDLHFNITKHKDPEDIHVYGNKAKIVDVETSLWLMLHWWFSKCFYLFIYLFWMKFSALNWWIILCAGFVNLCGWEVILFSLSFLFSLSLSLFLFLFLFLFFLSVKSH